MNTWDVLCEVEPHFGVFKNDKPDLLGASAMQKLRTDTSMQVKMKGNLMKA